MQPGDGRALGAVDLECQQVVAAPGPDRHDRDERPHAIFNVDACYEYVNTLVNLDEVERALLVLDNLPAYYRDHYPPLLLELRQNILKAQCTAHAYITSTMDSEINPEVSDLWIKGVLRGVLLEREVKRYNDAGLIPHIVDIGPGEYHAPIGLKRLGAKFTYQPIAADKKAAEGAAPYLADISSRAVAVGPTIFLALEIIEHLPSTQDLLIECLRHCGAMPDRIHLSTPCYTFDTRLKDWNKPCGLPHLRAYTPMEFIAEAQRLFPGYQWQMYQSELISLRGLRRDLGDDKPL